MGRCQWFGRALWTRLRREGSKGKVDGASPRGLCRRVVFASLRGQGERFLGLTGLTAGGVLSLTGPFGPEGCGLPLCGNAYKVSVTGLTFCII